MNPPEGSRDAKRIELLEELVAAVARWSADGHDRRLPGVLDAFNTIVDLPYDGFDTSIPVKIERKMDETTLEESDYCLVPDDDVKSRINELLYPLVPGHMTIRQFEVLSCGVYDLVIAAREKGLEGPTALG